MHTKRGPCWAVAILAVAVLIGLTGCATPAATLAPGHASLQVAPSPYRTTRPTPPTTPPTTPPAPSPSPPLAEPVVDAAAVTAAVRSVEPAATVGALVIDRITGTELLSTNADRQFRSASLVKLLIAIDALGTGADGEARKRIGVMLALSDDDIASRMWVAGGGDAILTRTAARLGLTATEPPATPGRWGDVLLTARDVARIYQHVMTALPAADRELVVASLAGAPRHAADRFHQHFGIPDGLGGRWAIKQGWSDSRTDIVVHTSGLVGPDLRHIVVLLTEHPRKVRWSTATASVTAGAKALAPLR